MSVDDLNDALMEETTDESEAEGESLLDCNFDTFEFKIQLVKVLLFPFRIRRSLSLSQAPMQVKQKKSNAGFKSKFSDVFFGIQAAIYDD